MSVSINYVCGPLAVARLNKFQDMSICTIKICEPMTSRMIHTN